LRHLERLEYPESKKEYTVLKSWSYLCSSGEEGVYPHLTNFAEQRLALLKPESRILRVLKPVMCKSLLEPQERKELEADVDDWMQQMRLRERDLDDARTSAGEQMLPQPSIRSTIEVRDSFALI
jgi:hypothetical protein